MIGNALLQYAVFFLATLVVSVPVAYLLTRLFATNGGGSGIAPVEKLLAWVVGPQYHQPQTWKQYTVSLIVFNVVGALVLFLMLLFQGHLPLNPQGFGDLSAPLAFNIMISWLCDTGWQSYSGEQTLTFFSQMVGLTSQNFLSCATGLGVSFTVARAFVQRENPILGNFYADAARSTVYVMLPLAIICSLLLIHQGVPQNMLPFVQATTLEGAQQTIAQGPVASQQAISIVGGSGAGFLNANSAHPYQNPTPLSNFIQMIEILIIPMALVLSLGQMMRDKKAGWVLFLGMTILFLMFVAACFYFERMPHPLLENLGVDQKITSINSGGNMEGKEVRFGIFLSSLWSILTTSTTQGSVNSAFDSYMPLGAVPPLLNMLFGEVIYGGVGYGRYGFLIYGMITVFLAGLQVGRTPEYMGKKIEAHEIKLAGIVMLLVPILTLCLSMLSLVTPAGIASITAEGPHGLTQTVYAYASSAGNNGTAFSGFNSSTDYQNTILGLVILLGRFGVLIPTVAIAGSLASKKIVPHTAGTFPTDGPLFIGLLITVIVLFGGLVYFPALALGPIAEHLALFSH
jgi:K+-transporting ATPase ATPase A chain